MKIIHMVVAGLIAIVPVTLLMAYELPFDIFKIQAAEHHSDPMSDLKQLVQCQAVDLSLARLHTQVAATMTALSGDAGMETLKPMTNGFLAIAKVDNDKATGIEYVIKQAMIPIVVDATHQPEETIVASINIHLMASIAEVVATLADPEMPMADRVGAEQALLDESGKCDDFASKIMRKNTY